jgi:hypothetical protein
MYDAERGGSPAETSDTSVMHRCVHCGTAQEVPTSALAARSFVRCVNSQCRLAPWDTVEVPESVEVTRLRHAWGAAGTMLLKLEQLPSEDPRRGAIPRLSARALVLGEELMRRGVV